MVTPNSRRSFLFGRRAPTSSWGNFCSRLSRTCQGSVRWSDDSARHEAWLIPARDEDLAHAFALCAEYGVKLMIDRLDVVHQTALDQPLLWVDPGTAWATCTIEQDRDAMTYRAAAGCNLSAIKALGFEGFGDAPGDWTVARWMASPLSTKWATGRGDHSIIERVQVRLSDGTVEVLGPFGATAQSPLRSLSVQQMVPKLFELALSPEAQRCARSIVWPARLRLDALMPLGGQEPNLAHLIAGHAGALAWVDSVWFRPVLSSALNAKHADPMSAEYGIDLSPDVVDAAAWLDQKIKKTFDPVGLFAPILTAKGIESAN